MCATLALIAPSHANITMLDNENYALHIECHRVNMSATTRTLRMIAPHRRPLVYRCGGPFQIACYQAKHKHKCAPSKMSCLGVWRIWIACNVYREFGIHCRGWRRWRLKFLIFEGKTCLNVRLKKKHLEGRLFSGALLLRLSIYTYISYFPLVK